MDCSKSMKKGQSSKCCFIFKPSSKKLHHANLCTSENERDWNVRPRRSTALTWVEPSPAAWTPHFQTTHTTATPLTPRKITETCLLSQAFPGDPSFLEPPFLDWSCDRALQWRRDLQESLDFKIAAPISQLSELESLVTQDIASSTLWAGTQTRWAMSSAKRNSATESKKLWILDLSTLRLIR